MADGPGVDLDAHDLDIDIDIGDTGGLFGAAVTLDEVVAADVAEMADEQARQHLLALHAAKCRVDAAVVAATGVVDRRRLFAADAARSSAGWLAGRVDQTRGRCAADVALARALREMPVVAVAARAGRLGRVKVDLLAEARRPEVVGPFALH